MTYGSATIWAPPLGLWFMLTSHRTDIRWARARPPPKPTDMMSAEAGDEKLGTVDEQMDGERRRIAQLRKDLEDREQRLRELQELSQGSGCCRTQGTQTSPRTVETQASASDMTRASETEAGRVKDKIETAQAALIGAL